MKPQFFRPESAFVPFSFGNLIYGAPITRRYDRRGADRFVRAESPLANPTEAAALAARPIGAAKWLRGTMRTSQSRLRRLKQTGGGQFARIAALFTVFIFSSVGAVTPAAPQVAAPDRADQLWAQVAQPYLDRPLWTPGTAYDAGQFLMVPLHAAFMDRRRDLEEQFSAHFTRFIAHRQELEIFHVGACQ